MGILRPKYQLDRAEIQGAVATIPAVPYTRLTGRRFPYPRVGTRAGPEAYTTNPGVLRPHYTLDKKEIQGVMPSATYYALTGRLTTARNPNQRRLGVPRTDVERTMEHYGISYEQAEAGLASGTLTLPVRGAGLPTPGLQNLGDLVTAAAIGFVFGILTGWGITEALAKAAVVRLVR